MINRLYLILGLLLIVQLSSAAVFHNAYLSFEMPDGWNCKLEATEWVCRNPESKLSREALIIFTAKEAGPSDSLSIYELVINTTKSVPDKTGKPTLSTVSIKGQQTKINDQTWVDGLQKGSEIPNYFTRYVATIKDKIAVLVTFSAHADVFAKYSSDFFKAVQSLRVVASKNLLAESRITSRAGTGDAWGATTPGTGNMDISSQIGGGRKPEKPNKLYLFLLALGASIIGAGVFFFLKARR